MFHVGQKVVCIDATGEEPHIQKGCVYTVTRNEFFPEFINVSCCAEHQDKFGAGWRARRFRPIVEKKTDISFAHEILRKVTRKQTVRA